MAARKLTISSLSHASNVISVTLNGTQYSVAVPTTLAANTLHMIYYTPAGLVISTNVNSVGPGTASWFLVGAFYSNGTDQMFGAFVTIDGAPTSLSAWASNVGTHSWGNITTITKVSRNGAFADISQYLTFTGGGGSGQLIPVIPVQLQFDFNRPINGTRFPLGMGSGTCGTGGALASVFAFPINGPAGGNSYEPLSLSNGPGAACTGIQAAAPATWQAGNYIHFRLNWPTLGWSNTPLRDL